MEGRPCAEVVDRQSSPKLSTPPLLRASYTNSTVSATSTVGRVGRVGRWGGWDVGSVQGRVIIEGEGREGELDNVSVLDSPLLNGVSVQHYT